MKTQVMSIDGITYTDSDVIVFDNGVPGFEHLRRYIITSVPEHEPFHWMHALEDENIKFILLNPLYIDSEYDPRIQAGTLKEIGVKSKDDLLMYVIVTINQAQFNLSTANMLGPVLININTKAGIQVILDDGRYSTKTPILKEGSQIC